MVELKLAEAIFKSIGVLEFNRLRALLPKCLSFFKQLSGGLETGASNAEAEESGGRGRARRRVSFA